MHLAWQLPVRATGEDSFMPEVLAGVVAASRHAQAPLVDHVTVMIYMLLVWCQLSSGVHAGTGHLALQHPMHPMVVSSTSVVS